jgi:hypothetical protein
MRLLPALSLLLLASCATTAPLGPEERATRWWADVSALASDEMEGRQTGTPGYQRAADYVVGRLKEIGLEPAGTAGYFQPVKFHEQFVDVERSRASLVSQGRETALSIPGHLIIGSGGGDRPERVDAPLVFIGYGLHIPEAGHDDLAGMDLKGKIAVYIGGGPAHISGALKSHARSQRAALLEGRGAVGMLALTTPKALESPWSRAMGQASLSGMYLADAELRDIRTAFFTGSLNPAEGERLFARSGRSFADIAAMSDASKPVPGFALNQSLRASIAARRRVVSSANLVARLPGSDPRLKDEHVVFTAHLDHLGITPGGTGDRLHNGALDNAAGVSGLLDIARSYKARGVRPRRSMLFVFVTAEEKGLLGSRYFALRPSVPRESVVADLNIDMALPLFPLKSVIALGAEESSLGASARAVAAEMRLPLVPDPFPERNSFIRSDQYSFIRTGIPALAFKFGFAAGTPEAEIEAKWRATHYHAPSDEVDQPVAREDAIRLHDFVGAIGLRVANTPERPRWLESSFFRRFATEGSR